MIAFDLDDVILNLTSTLSKYVEHDFGIDIKNRSTFYVKPDGISDKEFDKYFKDLMFKHTIECDPVPKSLPALKKIHNLLNIPIHIITARDMRYEKIVNIWAKKNLRNMFPYEISFSGNIPKYIFFKHGTKYFVDDGGHNVDKLVPYLETFFLFNRPWNRTTLATEKVVRVKNLEEVYSILQSKLQVNKQVSSYFSRINR